MSTSARPSAAPGQIDQLTIKAGQAAGAVAMMPFVGSWRVQPSEYLEIAYTLH